MKERVLSIIRKHALRNAVEHNGKALEKAVISAVLGEEPRLKKNVKELLSKVKKVVEEVNRLSPDEQVEELRKIYPDFFDRKKEKKKELPPLQDAEMGKVVTAFPPEPSKYPHIGHAKSALINYLYAKKYKGTFILRFEDSNPLKVRKEYYKAFKDGLNWLGIKWDKEDYLSDHMENFYSITQKLIEAGRAYVCMCPPERVRELRRLMKPCEHRDFSVKKNLELWDMMVNGEIKEGEASVRLKINMNHPNATMRDPSIMRPLHARHARVGNEYKVWPLYDFGTALLDAWEGVTHRIRSKEFEMRTELQNYIREICGFKNHPTIIEIARFELEGTITSGRVIREMISKGELLGWDDPRLVTLASLKRRGFLPEAIKEFLLETGISKSESKITWSILESINRRLVDPIANRYFGVFEPVEIKILNGPKTLKVEVPLHPDYPERGKRIIPVSLERIYIEKEDFEKFKGKTVRLKDLFNVKLSKESIYVGNEIVKEMPKIHWVSSPNVKVNVIMNDGSSAEVLAEPNIKNTKIDEIIQFERRGFFRVDKKDPLVLYFTHK